MNRPLIRTGTRFVSHQADGILVSFPTLRRCFRALEKLTETGKPAEYYGTGPGDRRWIRIPKTK